jgi:hypothetical protein
LSCALPLLALACVPPTRAQLPRLQQRAVFDLGCAGEQLYVVHIDERTKAVSGCGRRLVYLEDCDRGAGNVCSWKLDTPMPGQASWPGTTGMQAPPTIQASPTIQAQSGALRSGWMVPAGAPRPMKRDLFEAGKEPTPTAQPAAPATSPTQRNFRTDLYSGGSGSVAEGKPARRNIPTTLFEGSEAKPERPATPPTAAPPTGAPPGAATGAPMRRDISTQPPF